MITPLFFLLDRDALLKSDGDQTVLLWPGHPVVLSSRLPGDDFGWEVDFPGKGLIQVPILRFVLGKIFTGVQKTILNIPQIERNVKETAEMDHLLDSREEPSRVEI